MDDTLVHTRPLVERAYREAGVEMPPGTWGRPAAEWLVDAFGGDVEVAAKAHREKNEVYFRLLAESPPRELPALDVLRGVLGDPRYLVVVATAASTEAAYRITRQLGLFVPMRTRLTRADLVRFVGASPHTCVVINDSAETLEAVGQTHPWAGLVHAAPDKSAEVLAFEVGAEATRSESARWQMS